MFHLPCLEPAKKENLILKSTELLFIISEMLYIFVTKVTEAGFFLFTILWVLIIRKTRILAKYCGYHQGSFYLGWNKRHLIAYFKS